MISSAVNIAMLSSVFVKMMVDSMGDDSGWSDQEMISKALLCMLGLGTGEIIGSLAFGRITDKYSFKTTIAINAVAVAVAYTILIVYSAIYDFSFVLGTLMTFFWGVQDSGRYCFLNSVLGFQFESKTTPFSVFKFLQSMLIFVFTVVESLLSTQQAY